MQQEAALSQGRPRDAVSCTFRYHVSNFTPASRGFSARAQLSCIVLPVDTDFSSLARFKAALKRIDLSKFLTYCID